MTTSNTKLTQDQKSLLKAFQELLQELKGEIFTIPYYNCTVVVVPEFNNSKMVRVSISHSSKNEKKFRDKVGQYYALEKMFGYSSEYIKVPLKNNSCSEIAQHIAYLC